MMWQPVDKYNIHEHDFDCAFSSNIKNVLPVR